MQCSLPAIPRAFLWLALAAFLAPFEPARADLIALWDFNSLEDDAQDETGTLEPRSGRGSARAIGTVNATFGSVASGATSDTPSPNNSQIRLTRFPARTVGSKTSGLEFRVDTSGFEGIRVAWDHYNSGSASRYWRVQYSVDGEVWIDHGVFTNATPSTWRLANRVRFEDIPAANNNPHFAFRIVSEFESTATGGGLAEYQPASGTANYSTTGTLWIDMIRVEGYVFIPNNQPPAISGLPQVLVQMNSPTGPLQFTVGDVETDPDHLILSYTATPAELIADAEFGGSGTQRTFTVQPAPDVVGHATITIRVTDAGGKFRETSFLLAILPRNTPPRISRIAGQQIYRNQALGPISFTASDSETAPDFLRVTAQISDHRLFPREQMTLHCDGPDCLLALKPADFEVGSATITITVNDGDLERSTAFEAVVLPERTLAEWNFNSSQPDADAATGSLETSRGVGRAAAIGGVSETFGSVASGATTDAESPDNSMWRLARFPSQGQADRAGGVEFRASTIGYSNICVVWDHYNSATASRYWKIQITTNGETFTDAATFTNGIASAWQLQRGASFKGLPGVDHNPRFGMRFVAAFAPAAGSETPSAYQAVDPAASYSGGGTLWLDAVRVAGEALSLVNQAPVIAPLAPLRVLLGVAIAPIPLGLTDDRTDPAALDLSFESSNPALLPPSGILASSIDGVQHLRLMPNPGQTGSATVRITASDGSLSARASFDFEVAPAMLSASAGLNGLTLTWNLQADGYLLQESTNLQEWHFTAESGSVADGFFRWVAPLDATQKFFRLSKDAR